jgi:hypothetical protein
MNEHKIKPFKAHYLTLLRRQRMIIKKTMHALLRVNGHQFLTLIITLSKDN